MSEAPLERDWVHLPPGVEAEHLWHALHDARVCNIRSESNAGVVDLECDSTHIRDFHGLPEEWRFRFRFSGVRSVRAVAFRFPQLDYFGKTPEEQARLYSEAARKGREETVGWREFEREVRDTQFEVTDAAFVRSEDEVALRLGGFLASGPWSCIYIRAAQLTVDRSDGISFSLDELKGMGEAYWEAFSRGSEERQRLQEQEGAQD